MADGQYWTQTEQAIVGSDGTATAYLTPNAAGRYIVTLISVSVSQANSTSSICTLYRQAVTPANFIEGTSSGDRDADTQISLRLTTGQTLVAYWTGAVPGATAILRVEGEFTAEGAR